MNAIPIAAQHSIARLIERELERPQTNRVLHAHPSPLLWRRNPVDFESQQAERLAGERSEERMLGIYLGIPFCIPTDPPHCGFCLFPTEEYKGRNSADAYLDVLEAEADLIARMGPRCQVASVYIGGGTPNLLRDAQYDRLLGVVRRAVGELPEGIEKTVEGIPQLYTEDRVQAIKQAGFNRVSMGVQQINDRLVKYSGRKQTRKQVFEAIESFQKHGLAFNVDLIFGWPEQTVEGMLYDIEELIETGIQHITHYELNIGGISDFSLEQREKLPSRETVDQMYLAARELLMARGFVQRTVFDWERPAGKDAPRGVEDGHVYRFEDNLRRLFEVEQDRVTHSHEMLGIGYAAISFGAGYPKFDTPSWTCVNTRALKRYYDSVRAGLLPVDAYFIRSPVDVKISWLFQALQETRVDIGLYDATFGCSLREELGTLWSLLERRGWISIEGSRIEVLPEHHLRIPIIQTLIAARRREEIVAEHRALASGSQSLQAAV